MASACSAGVLDVVGGAVEAGSPAGEQGHRCAAGAERAGGGAADPAAGAGDDDDLGAVSSGCSCATSLLLTVGRGDVPARAHWWCRSARPASVRRSRAAGRARRPGAGCRAAGVAMTSYSSVNRPGGPQAARLRSNQRAALDLVALLVRGQGHQEPAQQERALGLVERAARPGGSGRRSRRRPAPRRPPAGSPALRGSSAGGRRARPGSSSAASTRGSSGARCQRPVGCRQSAAVSATRASARRSSRAASVRPAPAAAMARSPAAQISREWAHRRSSSSQMPASGSRHRASMAATAVSTACRCSESRRSCRAAAANSSRASPNASSWNWSLTGCRRCRVPPG